ncbi:hypothetical protein HanIR_Chr17g0883931 [Helianthus annuus]|nr:hypothetical protein HanIR_Chr17g0883931 [Helianthus annuus]
MLKPLPRGETCDQTSAYSGSTALIQFWLLLSVPLAGFNPNSKYSNQTLRYILKTMNKRQEHLQKIEKNLEGSRKEIEQMIEEWIQAREWYKDMYDSCNKYISYKKKIKKGDVHKTVKLN